MNHLTERAVRLAGAVVLAAAAAGVAAQGRSCESLREEIARKFEAGGVRQPDLRIVPAEGEAGGRVVGQCAQGSRRIVYVAGRAGGASPVAPATPARATEAILTECRDGSVSVGGDCGRRR